MNKAISTHGGTALDDLTESNQTGQFQRKAAGHDPLAIRTGMVWVTMLQPQEE
jgi:hypothetical protein